MFFRPSNRLFSLATSQCSDEIENSVLEEHVKVCIVLDLLSSESVACRRGPPVPSATREEVEEPFLIFFAGVVSTLWFWVWYRYFFFSVDFSHLSFDGAHNLCLCFLRPSFGSTNILRGTRRRRFAPFLAILFLCIGSFFRATIPTPVLLHGVGWPV